MADDNRAFQDFYPDHLAHCYGCGRLNTQGLRLRSFWDGAESVARFTPRPEHIAVPGYVYGGLVASLIDCHGSGTAAAAVYRRQNRSMASEPALRYVTAALTVDYLRPTPLGPELQLRGKIEEIGERKVVVSVSVAADNEICARGRVVAVRLPDGLMGEPDVG